MSSLPDGLGLRSPDWHFEMLRDFTEKKRAVGEPGSNLAILQRLCSGMSRSEKAWKVACYCATYCLPGAQALWSFPLEVAVEFGWEQWLTENWEGIVTRQERRGVRTPQAMARCLRGAARWCAENLPQPGEYGYDAVFNSAMKIPFFGRYIVIRFVEGLRQNCNIATVMPDMRNAGGWSPKKCLVYLYPQWAEELLTESREGSLLADRLVDELIARLADAGTEIGYYKLASILCDYRGAYEKRKEYPGWDIDIEPTLYGKATRYWSDAVLVPVLQSRLALFPSEALGEVQGWYGLRPALARTLRDYGYNWSDLEFDYLKTTDFANPVRRS